MINSHINHLGACICCKNQLFRSAFQQPQWIIPFYPLPFHLSGRSFKQFDYNLQTKLISWHFCLFLLFPEDPSSAFWKQIFWLERIVTQVRFTFRTLFEVKLDIWHFSENLPSMFTTHLLGRFWRQPLCPPNCAMELGSFSLIYNDPYLTSAFLELPFYLNTSPGPDEECSPEGKPMSFEDRCSCPLEANLSKV